MNIMSKIGLGLSVCAILSACNKRPGPDPVEPKPTTKEMHFTVANMWGGDSLKLGTKYNTPNGEEVTISTFKYYVSNIVLKAVDGSEYAEPESYRILDQATPASMHFHMNKVPVNNYTSVSFLIGVDSARNVSGAQTGALAVENGMFWTWKTGYIMAKLEGTSPQSTQVGNTVTLHIGGFSGPNSGLRKVTLNLNQGINLNSLESGAIDMKADARKWFEPNVIKIADKSEIMNTSETSKAIADNYANMFSISYAGGTIK